MGDVTMGKETAKVIEGLREKGINRQVVLMRHSVRHYSEDPRLEPFMGLTEQGKEAAIAFGHAVGQLAPLTPCSSYIGRCIETAYLLQRGSSCKEGRINTLEEVLSPFYVKDFHKIIELALKHDLTGFIRGWIDGAFPETIIGSASSAASSMLQFVDHRLAAEGAGVTVGVTHDWNVFTLKEFALKLPHEIWGKVVFLEGVVFFQEEGRLMAVNHQTKPVVVDPWLLDPGSTVVGHG